MNKSRLFGWGVLVAFVGLWEAAARGGAVEPIFFPPASAILVTFAKLVANGVIPRHMGASLLNMFAGYFLAAAVAVPFGVLLGYNRALRNLFEPTIELTRPVPASAIIPLAILLLGIGAAEKIFIIFFTCSRTMVVNAMYGAQSVDRRLIETARSYGYSGFRLVRRIVFPASMPQIMTGMRMSLAIAIVIILAAELLGSENGIGYYTMLMQRTYSTPEMYAGVLSLCVLGYVLNRLFVAIEGRAMGWYAGQKDTMH
jgi:ABC-type nitrate/sulfonate/bicarbonate transport system permease component